MNPMCPNNNQPIQQSDFDCVGMVAKHCDLPKLCIAITEASDFDMSEQLCDFWPQALAIIQEVKEYQDAVIACEQNPDCTVPPTAPDNYAAKLNLVCGGSYTGCNDKIRSHFGLVRAWVYYAYSRYVILNSFNDTPNGTVQKTNEFSIPTPLKEKQSFADKYRSMAFESIKKTLAYACTEKELFTELSVDQCGKCGCGSDCNSESSMTKGYGFRSSTIRKEIPGYGRLR